MKTSEVAEVFDELKQELAPLIDRGGGQPGGRLVPEDDVRDRPAARAEHDHPPALRLGREVLAVRRDRPSGRVLVRDDGHPDHDPLRRGRARVALLDHARVRPRSLRAAGRPALERHAARATGSRSGCTSRRRGCGRTSSAAACRSGAGFTRVCRRRSRPSSGRSRWRTSTAPSTRSSRRSSASRRTRSPTTCTSSCASSSNRRSSTGAIALADLPEAWNAKMKEYLGIDVPDDRRGVLQDVHWSGGGLGYFPTYSLGNVMSLQIWERVREAIPDLDEQFERGEFAALREWLRRQRPPLRAQVHAAGDAASGWPVPTRRRPLPPLLEGQGRQSSPARPPESSRNPEREFSPAFRGGFVQTCR